MKYYTANNNNNNNNNNNKYYYFIQNFVGSIEFYNIRVINHLI